MHWGVLDHSSSMNEQFDCGYCQAHTATAQAFARFHDRPRAHDNTVAVRICLNCSCPTYFDLAKGLQVPPPPTGSRIVEHLPSEVDSAYREARAALGASAPTAAALMCRKVLMNVSVKKGAKPGLRFVEYIKFLVDNHHVPPGSDMWLAHIKDGGNDATHEIPATTMDDAKELLLFTESLLTYTFELPGRIKPKKKT